MTDAKNLKRKLAQYSEKDKRTGCRVWTGARTNNGYGAVYVNPKTLYAHRVSWEVHNGPIPEDSVVHHTCANRCCINPNHLQIITQAENLAEMMGRKTYEKRIAELEKKLEECTCGKAQVEAVDSQAGV